MNRLVALPERLDHDAARDLHAELAIHRGFNLVIDGSSVRVVGALAAQVLVAAARDWGVQNTTLSVATSIAMKSDLERLGVLDELSIQEAI